MRIPALLVLLLAVACTPLRRDGGGDDDDSANPGDDDDAADDDDDDAFSVENELSMSGSPIGSVTLPAIVGVVRDEQTGLMSANLYAGAGVSCSAFADYGDTWLGLYRAYDAGDIDVETYIAELLPAILELVGPSSWIALIELGSSTLDADADIDLVPGNWPEPNIVTLGRAVAVADGEDLLAEGGSVGSFGDGTWGGSIDDFSNGSGLIGSFTAGLDWGDDEGLVSIDGTVSAGICLVVGSP